jgi:hypothetical protein
MKVELNLEDGYCEVTKEKGDPYFKKGYSAMPESTFLYHVKKELIKQGFDVIKKRIASDPGNLVDEYQQWIRTRNWNIDGDKKIEFSVYNGNWAMYDAGEEFNHNGKYTLTVLQ